MIRRPTSWLRREAPVPVRWAAAVAVLSGLAAAAAFPQLGIWPLAMVSVAGLSWAVDGRRARTGGWLGFCYGVAFFAPLLHWTGVYVGPVPWLILAVFEAVFMAGLGAVLTLVQRLPGAAFWIACAWVLQEALRDRLPFGGFPWGRLAFSQADSPLRWIIVAGGAPLLSFAVALIGGAVAVLARSVPTRSAPTRSAPVSSAPVSSAPVSSVPVSSAPQGLQRRGVRLPRAALAGAVAAMVLVPAVAELLSTTTPSVSSGHRLRVALIQGSVPPLGLEFEARAEQVLDNHVRQTMKLAREIKAGTVAQPDLVVWPENASDVDPLADPQAGALITKAVRAVNAPVLVGAILNGPGPNHRRNAGILWSPTTGPGAMYIKRHPVPFAEYMPLRSIADKVSSAARLVTQDMVAGKGNGLLTGGPAPIGDVICFEVAYDDLVQSSVAAGAQLLVVQTNNATFGHTSETYQQLAMSKLRAIETGRTVLQVSTTGASAIIDPDGHIVAESPTLFRPAILTADIDLETAQTSAVRLGALPEWLLAGLGIAAAASSVLLSIAGRRRPATDPAPVTPEPEVVHQ